MAVAASAVLLPTAFAGTDSETEAAAKPTVDSATTASFGRLADAVLTQRTAALLDSGKARRSTPTTDKRAGLSAGWVRSEKEAVSSLRSRKGRLAALGEVYTSASTDVRVDKARVKGDRATVRVTETTTLTYKKIRGDEPTTTGFEAHHELNFAFTRGGTWELTGMRSTDEGPVAVNEPFTARAAVDAAEEGVPTATPAATRRPSRQTQKPPGTAGYDYAAMAAYAEKYWSNYNPAYPAYDSAGGDCTNFVSQALKAGGWKHDPGLYSDYRNWWYDPTLGASLSFVGANEWSWFALHSKRTTNLGNVYDMGIGDVLQVDFDRDGSKDHTMMTTYRSRYGTPYLTYHSTNTYRKSVASLVASYPDALYYAYRT
ncbi:amidase domain-containing protein [Streptomyces sp. NPDC093546]|uniref:amidase domain-containing protein n=1 Tax=Streptomyces sp. NPDC093546 TaxID=3366040 RepID=UPI0037F6DBD4